MEMNCDFSSTCGDDSGFSLHPWRCSAGGLARTRPIIANSYHWASRTARSSPMEMNCDFSSTYGDDSGSPLHPRRCSASSHAWTGKSIANGHNWDTRTPISSPMEMNCDFSSTYGNDSGFPLHLWRYTPDTIAHGPQSWRPTFVGPRARAPGAGGTAQRRPLSPSPHRSIILWWYDLASRLTERTGVRWIPRFAGRWAFGWCWRPSRPWS